MKRTYWENTTKERGLLTSVINQLLEYSQDYSGLKVESLKLIDDAATDNAQ